MAWIITFNSFKGGSGRSTTCINIAAQLARSDKRVLVIDLDIDGPGLGTLFGLTDKEVERSGIVSYLSSSDSDATRQHVGAIRNHTLKVAIEDIEIDFMGAPLNADASAFEMAGTELPDRLAALKEAIETSYDFVLIDAASGISDTSALAFAISDSICLCFRWSRQHFRGTMMTLSIVCKMLEAQGFPLQDFTLVANAVPHPVTSAENDIVKEVRKTINSLLRERFGSRLPNGLPLPKIQDVWEISTMKFYERIVAQDDKDKDAYSALANYLIDRARIAK
jgi:MinD-like ATPase involved in chromosome partitioning or flagellar assembly